MSQHKKALSLSSVLISIALAPVARPQAKAVSVTPKGLKLINHYRGGVHYFTVAE